MLCNLNWIVGRKVHATDGDLGHVDAFFFDETTWKIRYMVVETGNWLLQRKVLLSPTTIFPVVWDSNEINVGLTREQVETSPDVDTDKPVSRQQEIALSQHYIWPAYWAGGVGLGAFGPSGLYGVSATPVVIANEGEADEVLVEVQGHDDPHLLSSKHVQGYRLRVESGQFGNIHDFIFDDADWSLRFLVVDTGSFLPGRKVPIAVEHIDQIDTVAGEVYVDLSRALISDGPEFDPSRPMTTEDVLRLREFYGDRGAYLG